MNKIISAWTSEMSGGRCAKKLQTEPDGSQTQEEPGILQERSKRCYIPSLYPRSPHLWPEAAVDCVGKPLIFIQCSCFIAPLCGYESAL